MKKKNNKTHSLLLQNANPELEVKMNVINTYDIIETYQDGMELANMIWNICNLYDDNKQYTMAAVETDEHA